MHIKNIFYLLIFNFSVLRHHIYVFKQKHPSQQFQIILDVLTTGALAMSDGVTTKSELAF